MVVTRSEHADDATLDAIDRRVALIAPRALRVRTRMRPRALVRATDGTEMPLSALDGAAVLAWAGIGNPRAFAAGLEALGARVVATRFGRDHRRIVAADVVAATRAAAAAGATLVVVTRKDLVKLRRVGSLPESLVSLDVEVEPSAGALAVAELALAAEASAS